MIDVECGCGARFEVQNDEDARRTRCHHCGVLAADTLGLGAPPPDFDQVVPRSDEATLHAQEELSASEEAAPTLDDVPSDDQPTVVPIEPYPSAKSPNQGAPTLRGGVLSNSWLGR